MNTLEHLIAHEREYLPDQAPLEFFVHHNTLHHLEGLLFEEAVELMAKNFGRKAYMNIAYYREQLKAGRINSEILEEEIKVFLNKDDHLYAFFKYLLLEADLSNDVGQYHYEIKNLKKSDSEIFKTLFESAPIQKETQSFFQPPTDNELAKSDELLVTFLSSYMDQGVSYWRAPEEGHTDVLSCFSDFLSSTGVSKDFLTRFNYSSKAYKENPLGVLEELSRPHHESVIKETLRRLPGWAGMVSKLERSPQFAARRKPFITLNDYLFITLNLQQYFPLSENPSVFSEEDIRTFLAYHCLNFMRLNKTSNEGKILMTFFSGITCWDLERILHLSFERTYMEKVLCGLTKTKVNESKVSKKYQVFFCLDDREESIRRHFEEASESIETFGVAGFFGLDMNFQSYRSVRHRQLCPPAVTPSIIIKEALRDEKRKARDLPIHTHYGQRTLFRSTLMSVLQGPFRLLTLKKKILFNSSPAFIDDSSKTELLLTYSEDEMASRVASILTGSGLIKEFAPLVILIGHGSHSMNNPHLSAYRCGACAGGNGAPNARGFAMMANNPQVRTILEEKFKISIPVTTTFVGGFHDTCSDDIVFSDEDLIPEGLKSSFADFKRISLEASEKNAQERLRRLQLCSLEMSPKEAKKQAEHRSNHPGETRPELGHASNALSFVGRRNFTKNVFLDRRAFLTSYDPTIDSDGKILEALLKAVIPVCSGISLEYYFSKIDNDMYGCGTKTPHNVTSLLGVINGSIGDLKTGLVWQMVELHEPYRNLFIIETSKEILLRVLNDNPAMNRVIKNRWVFLAIKNINSNEYLFYKDGDFIPVTDRSYSFLSGKSSQEIYQGKREQIDFAIIKA